jgi:hypothetical protein
MKTLSIVLLLILSYLNANPQSKISEITAPTSPASSVLGLQASEILSPKSFRALETALYSNFVDANNSALIPNDFALEFTPYWTTDHGLTLQEYLFPKNNRHEAWRNSSFSLASTQNLILGDSSHSNGLGFGYRTSIHIPTTKDKENITRYWNNLKDVQTFHILIAAEFEGLIINEKIKSKEKFLDTARFILPDKIKSVYKSITEENVDEIVEKIINGVKGRSEEFSTNDFDAFMQAFSDLILAVVNGDAAFSKFEEYIRKRNGWTIDIAAACLVSFPTNEFTFSYAPRKSVWITPSYMFSDKLDFLKAIAVFRKDWYDIDYYRKYYPEVQYYKSNFDYGVGLSLEFEKFSIQTEAVWRSSYTEILVSQDAEGNDLYRKDSKNSFQCVGTFSYRISNQVAISYTLGDKFNLGTLGNSLISVLSLNLGFGNPSILPKED